MLFTVAITNPKKLLLIFKPSKIRRLLNLLFRDSYKERERLVKSFSMTHGISQKTFTLKIPRAFLKTKKAIPVFDKIDVSIIIPVYNKWELTEKCLLSIIHSVKSVEYEIILADDCSTDKTRNSESLFKNLKKIKTPQNVGFLKNCNNAAKCANGKFLVFLNNDVLVNLHWLEALYDKMVSDENIAICGSKLLYENGVLQEAGGIIWRDASGWNYGKGDIANKPEYSYFKEVDYVSGASMMVRRDFWETVGGFDERFAPAYYEDVDLAFQAIDSGKKVIYNPHSTLVHLEGASHGKDEVAGIKRFQKENQNKFLNKWKKQLSDRFANGDNLFYARDRSNNKRTIVIVDHYVPMFDKDAGSKSLFMYIKLLVESEYNVKFIGDNFYCHQPYTDILNELGVEVLYGNYYSKNWQSWIKDNYSYIDVFYLHRPHIASKYIDFIKSLGECKIVYQCVDLHYLRVEREYSVSGDAKLLTQIQKLKDQEFDLFRKSDLGVTFSSYEKKVLEENNILNVEQVPLYLYEDDMKYSNFKNRDGIMFVGGFTHKPNLEGVNWFLSEVWPDLISEFPDLTFYIAGSNVPDEIIKNNAQNIKVLGFITDQDLDTLYENVKVNLIPLLHGAGVKGKLIESMNKGTPFVSTSVGLEGIEAYKYGLKSFDSPKEFFKELKKLLSDEKYWAEHQIKLKQAFGDNFSVNKFKKRVREVF